MSHNTIAWSLVALLGAASLSACASSQAAPAPSQAQGAARDRVARGKYLVTIAGCRDCHSPKKMGPKGPEPDPALDLSGYRGGAPMAQAKLEGAWIAATNADLTAWAGPWGISYAINLTPDDNTGIGIWTEQMFVSALRTGRHMGASRPILPPMPWQNLAQMDDEDLRSIYAYLRTITPVTNRVPDPVIVEPPAAK